MNIPAISIPKISLGADSSKYVKLAAPAGAIAVSALVLLFVVWPTFNNLIKLNISNRQLSTRAASLESKAQDLSTLDRDRLDQQLSASEQLLPSDKGVFTIVQEIEKSASSSGVILNKIDVAPGALGETKSGGGQAGAAPTPGQSAQTSTAPGQNAADLGSLLISTPRVQLKVAITSDYQGLLRFLNTLDSLSRIVSIHDLTMATSGGVGGSSAAVKTLLTVDAYWQPLPRELPAVETPISKISQAEEDLLKKVVIAPAPQSLPPSGGSTSAGSVSASSSTGKSDLFAPF
ncbi:hypothetical protein HY024_01935 [Candidatus Curtissbacteria bacterium]|nr:hypothetical protein [Candidatus Curtissbacteria bacterium]